MHWHSIKSNTSNGPIFQICKHKLHNGLTLNKTYETHPSLWCSILWFVAGHVDLRMFYQSRTSKASFDTENWALRLMLHRALHCQLLISWGVCCHSTGDSAFTALPITHSMDLNDSNADWPAVSIWVRPHL